MIITVLILTILAGIAIPSYEVIQRKTIEWELKLALRTIRNAIDRFYDANNRYPKNLNELLKKDIYGKKYLRVIPIDPLTGKRDWLTISSTDDPDDFIRLFSDKRDVYDIRTRSKLKDRNGEPYDNW